MYTKFVFLPRFNFTLGHVGGPLPPVWAIEIISRHQHKLISEDQDLAKKSTYKFKILKIFLSLASRDTLKKIKGGVVSAAEPVAAV